MALELRKLSKLPQRDTFQYPSEKLLTQWARRHHHWCRSLE